MTVLRALAAACCALLPVLPVGGAEGAELRAGPVAVALDGSLQNPCWSPDGRRLVFTRFSEGYNEGLSDLFVVAADGGEPRQLTDLEAQSVNLPGACWSAADRIVFVSDAVDRDEVWIAEPGGALRRVTDRPGKVAFEASFSPDGSRIVLESHPVGVEGRASLWTMRADGRGLKQLTDGSGDDRQPNWSPRGDRIVFQSQRAGSWDVWLIGPDGGALRRLTGTDAEDTDASFSPDGRFVVYSSDQGGDFGDLHVIAVDGGKALRIRHGPGYAGAPAWSPDGRWIAFETAPVDDPDGTAGTTLALVAAP